ncbi:hypothetical protein DYY67_0315 [Candidatus Nitrosotalea sp. TS]|uniref:hypothetical protein n=1 Tax=Candidatus Nitrosotalea sp. TS TaxID=2341020 RepID=UPI00140C29BF|nr:hypothetical protein [Candidatus Nitrosotalea sp. TS]NHI03194.1 hypothetical protein [Candidatus Nitrosotalea sp. TS]
MAYKISVAKKKIGTSLAAHVGIDPEVDYEIGVFFGSKLDELTEAGRNKIMTLSSKNQIFAWALGHGAGLKFKKNSFEVKKMILNFADKSPYFSGGLGHGLSRHIRKLATSNSLEPIMEFAEEHPVFAFDLAYDLGYHFGAFSEKIKQTICHIATKNDQFAFRVGDAIGGIYEELESRDREFVMDYTGKNKHFSKGFSKSSHKKEL